jgi:mannose-6-phosphate isomerase-like protein (cupin superfamily)
MAIEIVDVLGLAHERKKRKVIMDTRKMHAWMHYYPEPGDHDDLHCHPGDQTFMCLEGECTMHFPDGGSASMKPGMTALIEGGSFYRLENTGTGPMIMMGTRTGPNSANKHINYESGEDYLAMRGKREDRVNGFIMPAEIEKAGTAEKN